MVKSCASVLLLLCAAGAHAAPRSLFGGRVLTGAAAPCDTFEDTDPKKFADKCYNQCPHSPGKKSKPLSDSMLLACGKNALANHGKSDDKPGPGCPIGGLFDLGGVCCMSCMAECNDKPASFSPATSYALSTLAFLFVVMGSVWAFGRAAIDRLKEDAKGMGTYMAGLPTEEYNKLQQKVEDAAATAGSQIAADKDMLESGAKDAAYTAMEDGVTGGNVVGDVKKKGCDVVDNIMKQVVGDADEIKTMANNLPAMGAEEIGNVKEKLMGKLGETRAWSLFNIGRFLVAEIAILVALLTPPACLSGLKTACKDGFFCCFPVLLYDVKVFAALLGVAVNLGIPMFMVYKMRQKGGRQAYFPGSLSNKLFTLVTKTKMMKVVPTCDPQKGRGRISVGTKYMLGLCGYAIGLGVALELASDMKALIGSGCSGNMSAAISAMKAALLAIAAKFPELVMYYMLFLVYCAEFTYNFWTACCGVCCGRGLDNSDKDKRPNINSSSSSAEFPDGKHCCQGVCDTREDPPKGRGCNQPWIETFFYKFYCWFFFAIEDIFGAFYLWEPKACCFFFGPTVSKVMRMCPCLHWFPDIYIPYWPNLDAFKKDYEKFEFQWKLDEDTPHGRVMNRE